MKRPILIFFLLLLALGAFSQSKTKTKTVDTSERIPTPVSTAFRMHYDDLFGHNADGSVSPKQPIIINGEMIPTSTKITNGVKYGGVVIADYLDHDMMVDTVRSVVIIREFLK